MENVISEAAECSTSVKYKMADAAHIGNGYIAITQPQLNDFG